MIQEEALGRFVGVGRECPGAARLADRVPCPHSARLDRFARPAHAFDLAPWRLDPDPVAIGDARVCRGATVDVQVVVRMNLAQPRVLRIPRVIHRHRSLGNRRQGKCIGAMRRLDVLALQRCIVERQWIEVSVDPLTQMRRRLLARPSPLCSETESLQHF